MKTVAVICEFNPFHNGHEYLISEIKKNFGSDICVVAIMSASFCERGIPAVFPPYYRAKEAITGGADLVVELPFPWSASGARDFAKAGVSIAKSVGSDIIAFGSESADISYLEKASESLYSDEFEKKISEELKKDKKNQYAKIREKVFFDLFGYSLPTLPNDILGVEYINCAKRYGIGYFAIKRKEGFSASGSRELLLNGDYSSFEKSVPHYVSDDLKILKPYDYHAYSKACAAILRMGNIDPRGVYALPDGLFKRISAISKEEDSLDSILEKCATKKYTNSLIRRSVIHLIIGTKSEDVKENPLFTYLLGANQKGREAISKSSFKIISRESEISLLKGNEKRQALLRERANMLYGFGDKNPRSHFPYIEK